MLTVYGRGARRGSFCPMLWDTTRRAFGMPRRSRHIFHRARLFFIATITISLFMSLDVNNACALSIQDYPSFSLNIFGYETRIFYRQHPFESGLSTSISINHQELTVGPSTAEKMQKRIEAAQEVELSYHIQSWGGTEVDLLSRIPTSKRFGVAVFVHLQRTPVVGEIGNLKVLSQIEHLSADPDSNHFDEYGYRLLTGPVPGLVMQQSRYSRVDGRPLFFIRHQYSKVGPAYSYNGYFLCGARARVLYNFRGVAEKHWITLDKALFQFVGTVLGCPH